jgi:predicted O-methyltransferase YrrM
VTLRPRSPLPLPLPLISSVPQVINPDATDKMTEAIRRFNAKVHADNRVDVCMLPTADGITVARKRAAAGKA